MPADLPPPPPAPFSRPSFALLSAGACRPTLVRAATFARWRRRRCWALSRLTRTGRSPSPRLPPSLPSSLPPPPPSLCAPLSPPCSHPGPPARQDNSTTCTWQCDPGNQCQTAAPAAACPAAPAAKPAGATCEAAPAWLQAYYDDTAGTAWVPDTLTWACRPGLFPSPCVCVWTRNFTCASPCSPTSQCQIAPSGAPCPATYPLAPANPRCAAPPAAAAYFSGASGWAAAEGWAWSCLPGVPPYAPAARDPGPGGCVPCSVLQPLLGAPAPPAGAEWIDDGPECTNRSWRPRAGYVCNATACRGCGAALPGNGTYSGGFSYSTLDTAARTGSAARCLTACDAGYFPLPGGGGSCAACQDVLAASGVPASALPARARWQAAPAACDAGSWECAPPWVRSATAAYCCPTQVPQSHPRPAAPRRAMSHHTTPPPRPGHSWSAARLGRPPGPPFAACPSRAGSRAGQHAIHPAARDPSSTC